MEKKEFDIKMRTGDMFSFMMRQRYSGFSGFFAIALNVIVILCLVLKWTEYDLTAKLLLIFILLFFDVYLPFQLLLRAKTQVLVADRFQTSTHYIVEEKGITVTQGEELLSFEWGHFFKYVNTSKRIYVYTTRITAFIFSKELIGEENANYLLSLLHKNKGDFGTKALETAVHILPEEKVDSDKNDEE